MIKNPTLQVNTLSKFQRMDMLMENIRQTNVMGDKSCIINNKQNDSKFNKNKANVLMKLCLYKQNNITENHADKQQTLDNVNYNKQLEEIEILINIIKKYKNVPKSENHTPLVHVPLPREFYELKPLVSFKSIGRKLKKRSSATQLTTKSDAPFRSKVKDTSTKQPPEFPKTLQTDAPSTHKPDDFINEKIVVRKHEKSRTDRSTLTSSRIPQTYDKSTSITYKPETLDGSTSISSGVPQSYEKSALATQKATTFDRSTSVTFDLDPIPEESVAKLGIDRSTSLVELSKTNHDKHTLTSSSSLPYNELESSPINKDLMTNEMILSLEKDVNRMKNIEKPIDDRLMREMSTISSNHYENELATYPSLESVTFIGEHSNTNDANNLCLIENSWTIIDSVVDPLKNAKQVKVNHSSGREYESESLKAHTIESEISVFSQQLVPELILNETRAKYMVNLQDKTEYKPQPTSENLDEPEDKPHESVAETKAEVTYVNKQKEVDASGHTEHHKSVDITELASEDIYTEEIENNVEEPIEPDANSVTYDVEIPELNLNKEHKIKKKHLDENGLDVRHKNIDFATREEFNKVESELPAGLEMNGSTSVNNREKTVEGQSEGEVAEKDGEDKAKEVTIVEPELAAKSADKPKRRRTKSRKRSKRKEPNVELSDYKGFYVIHTTNDWSFS